jgi:FixJ family two-component response regulator
MMGDMPVANVFLVDDDAGVRTAMTRMLRAEGFTVFAFDSAEAFLARDDVHKEGCVVLDVTMPGLDGLALQQKLADSGLALPIVFVTGHGDIPRSVQAIKAGATDFLTKPVRADALIAAVRAGLASHAANRAIRIEHALLRRRLLLLTAREAEVLSALAAGKLNKQIAAELGIVEQTVKFHRARIMEKMEARTVAELMHMAARFAGGTGVGDAAAVPPP